jgi:protein-S-isoprenylcysteine O-methyltransferase Ste14
MTLRANPGPAVSARFWAATILCRFPRETAFGTLVLFTRRDTLSRDKNMNPEETTNADGAAPDSPGVVVFPPFLFFGALFVGIGLQLLWPVHPWPALPARIVGAILAVLGAAVAIPALRRMRRAGTNVHPGKPTTVIVNDGPYRFTRNPIYVANTALYIGLTLLFHAFWPLVSLVPALLVLHWGVVRREERYLEAKFGEAYVAYKARVRRWL